MQFYNAYICENGHAIHTTYGPCDDKFCAECGEPVISQCPSCGEPIRGHASGECGCYHVPSYCRNCGEPYPWTKTIIQATIDLLAEDDDLPIDDKERLIEVLPDVITETPKTQLASVRMKKALTKCGGFVAEALRQFAIDFGCELAKQQLGF